MKESLAAGCSSAVRLSCGSSCLLLIVWALCLLLCGPSFNNQRAIYVLIDGLFTAVPWYEMYLLLYSKGHLLL